MNGLDLFSGIGGISYALRDYVRPVAYCEIDTYCQAVLLSRMSSNEIATSPIWDDIRTLDPSKWRQAIDIIYGGFPCQDISIAGNGKGLEGERSGLFYEILRLAKEIKPSFIFLENVPAIRSRGGLQVVREVAELGYDCRWLLISAKSCGASHKRERWFMLAYSKSERLPRGLPIRKEEGKPLFKFKVKYDEWDEEPKNKLILAGMANGLPCRMDQIKCLGNAVVPQQCKKAFEILMGIK